MLLFTGGSKTAKKISSTTKSPTPYSLPPTPYYLIFLLIAFPAFAQETKNDAAINAADEITPSPRYSFSMSASSGVLLGRTEEIVYKNPTGNDYLSELLWQVMPVWYIGAAFEFSPKVHTNSGFYAAFKGTFGVPFSSSGTMQDRDWTHDNDNKLTNFSEHTNRTRALTLLSLRAGWSFPAGKFLAVRTYLNINYDYFSFSAKNGYYSYESDLWEKKNLYGELITFTQMFAAISPGVSFYFPLHKKFSFDVFAGVGYVFIYKDEDNHLKKDMQFIDFANGGIAVHAGTNLSLKPRGKFSFNLNFSYRYKGLIRGYSEYSDTNNGILYLTADPIGAALSLFDLGLSITLSL